jgi:glutamate--cysteine ligase
VAPLAAGLAGLLYDDDLRRTTLAALAGEEPRLASHWAEAAAGTLDPEMGSRLLGGFERRAVAA